MKPSFLSPRLEALQNSLKAGHHLAIEGLWNAPKALVAALAQEATHKHIVILTSASQEEAALFHDFALFTDIPVVNFPAWETLPHENIPPSPDIVGERYQMLHQLEKGNPLIILTGLQACLQKLIPPKDFRNNYFEIRKGDTLPFEETIGMLALMGYKRMPVTSDKGEFAVRGGIIDIFPVSSPDPFRIEFWGDQVETLRVFDPIGQKSVRAADKVEIPPAQELEMLESRKDHATLFDYLGPDTLVIFDDLLALEDRYAKLVAMMEKRSPLVCTWDELLKRMEGLQKIFWARQPLRELGEVRVLGMEERFRLQGIVPVSFEIFNNTYEAHLWRSPFCRVADFLQREEAEPIELSGEEILQQVATLTDDQQLHLYCSSDMEEQAFKEKVQAHQITLPKKTTIERGYLSSGFALEDGHHLILPLTEITRKYKIRRQKLRSTYHTTPIEPFSLNPGDTIVHNHHGVGRFLGIEKRPNHAGIETEFFSIEYSEGSRLFVPLDQAHLITRYIGSNDVLPKLNTIGSSRWKHLKEKTQQEITAYAADLLDIYAKREIHGGFAYPADSSEMLAFEEDFPFVETEDQLRAIGAVKKDMLSAKPMERLVCGDVGYGKTEVAMRAAFKAVVDGGKQVALLVPTTVLALQHYENFCERMANFPLRVGVLSRFQTAKETRMTLEGVAAGSIDILIGTHRIIGEDVLFKDLGLVVIDEEQRFGVKAKEHLKKIKTGVDCLTLSATPIPRTLYMSMIGARDMSVISTPPQDRLPIKTVIAEMNDQILKNALTRELARDGQAFVIHNRVETIYEMATRIKTLIPEARVIVGHGQMSAAEIDKVFHMFKSGKANILVATTIVENGIDIPNANTILIDRADRFGLADLYQLRGRVGRWNRRAYAYFLVPHLSTLPEITKQRLSALAETSGYGGGMKVAMRDLEIRGAGDLLGTKQSGIVSSVGFHLYCKMLRRTIQRLQGNLPVLLSDTKVDYKLDARLPENYINEMSLRMEIYQRLGEAISFAEVDLLWEEILDRFGVPPPPALNLYHLTRVRVAAARKGLTLLKIETLSATMEKEKNQQKMIKKITLPKDAEIKKWENILVEAIESF